MAAGGEGGAVQDEVGGVLRSSVTQVAGGIARDCAVHPAAEPRGVNFQAITANQHSDTKVGSGSGLSIVQSGGPMMGRFAKGEVAVANWKVCRHSVRQYLALLAVLQGSWPPVLGHQRTLGHHRRLRQSSLRDRRVEDCLRGRLQNYITLTEECPYVNIMIDVKQPFTGVFPRGFSPWSGYQLFKGWEVEIATLGHLVGRPWIALKIFRWMRSSISDLVLDIVHSSHI